MAATGWVTRTVKTGWARVAFMGLSVALMGAVWTQPAATAAQDMPAIPDPVAVQLDASTTAYLVLDMVDAICPGRPSCPSAAVAAASLLARAREAGAMVIFTTGRAGGSLVPPLEALPGEPFVGGPADKFFESNLDDILVSHGIQTVVVGGQAANGAPLYTTFGANMRGYTAVVLSDVLPGDTPFDTYVAQYQMLHEPGFDNAGNTPLIEGRVTLSRTDLVSFN